MKSWAMTKPCDNCPFLKKGGIRLSKARIREIAGGMLHSQGATFSCHKTVIYDDAYDDDGESCKSSSEREQFCAGALIFAEKHQNATQVMRIAERLGFYDAAALMADTATVASVFDSLPQMLKTALPLR